MACRAIKVCSGENNNWYKCPIDKDSMGCISYIILGFFPQNESKECHFGV